MFKGEAERAERRWRDMARADRALLTGLDLARAEEWLLAALARGLRYLRDVRGER
jgi:hypothetical protein